MVNCKMVHEMIRVYDLERSLKFYDEALGMKESRRIDKPEGKFTLVYLKDGESDFELELTYNYDPEEPYELGTGYGHIAVYVDDLELARKEHEEAGYTVGPFKGLTEGVKEYYFLTDPDGYQIEVMQRK
ncbi:MAG: VOC family protein [Methanosphaera sp.]|uniref:lactoylglutathione lyase n=1 Tax=Methanosphaera sp. TaxID=2666342 RepID=UPI002E792622|nr:VOC family protein [Methanosphaera sp.]MBE6487077.1 lactoylglutathione lyase [Methanosphaera stadtmanae]MEE1116600.1 VOC family protein [Methanosphaera sp.]MEE3325282.1 VOC family protein [Methanosphaera sp.]MEE3419040.1 VOC family protein [Methanosphaera sp.]